MPKSKQDKMRDAALDYHRTGPGKISMKPITQLETQLDLALAYSPGVAVPCEEIAADPLKALDYTSRGNIVAVISNGTAVLGLGDIGALASKPQWHHRIYQYLFHRPPDRRNQYRRIF